MVVGASWSALFARWLVRQVASSCLVGAVVYEGDVELQEEGERKR